MSERLPVARVGQHELYTKETLQAQDGKTVPFTLENGGPVVGQATLRYEPHKGALEADIRIDDKNVAEWLRGLTPPMSIANTSIFDDLIVPPLFRGAKLTDELYSEKETEDRRATGVAGSYNHIIDEEGNLLSNKSFVDMIENLGDAYEMAEELYGMIWWLADELYANAIGDGRDLSAARAVKAARAGYKEGLTIAKKNKFKTKTRG